VDPTQGSEVSEEPGLFDATPFLHPAAEHQLPDDLSADRRRTLRQQQNIRDGIHPLTRGRLHPEASTERTREDGIRDPFTCGTCCHRKIMGGYPKCDIGPQSRAPTTDVRAWWPACPTYASTIGVTPVKPLNTPEKGRTP
jgi:hypothetical protein